MVDPEIDLAAVGFELRLTRPARADATAQLTHALAATGEARQLVLQLRKLHLQLALTGAGVAGKDVQDQLRPVDHAAGQGVIEVAQLGRR